MEILRLSISSEREAVPVLHVSTLSVFAPPGGAGGARPVCREDDPLANLPSEGYALSKWVADRYGRRLSEAVRGGLPEVLTSSASFIIKSEICFLVLQREQTELVELWFKDLCPDHFLLHTAEL